MIVTSDLTTGSGISQTLAKVRRASIRELRYELHLAIPTKPDRPIKGRVLVHLELETSASWPALDFAPEAGDAQVAACIRLLTLDGVPVTFDHSDGHIRIAPETEPTGSHTIEVRFESSQSALKHRDDLVYTLFVPAKAHHVFPCFDQPDLKAALELELELPADWEAIANAPDVERSMSGGRRTVRFAESEPLPPYLFAFAAGRLLKAHATIDSRELCLMHQCQETELVSQNLAEVFRLHAEALQLLEDYTGIAHPFATFACVLIPDLEFAGMEHPGCIFYRENLILLDATATERDHQRRANLIAHETAHLWFGGLVTMRWFDDVWLKEVFANFMADKCLAQQFPDVEHELGFLLRHFPAAYAIDRTNGTHAIRRSLDNLSHAAELYDALIYHKAPIAMARLEAEIGDSAMRAGLRAYLSDFRFANADWPELRTRLEETSGRSLTGWSRRWIESPGRPRLPTPSTRQRLPEYGTRELSEADAAHLLLTIEFSPASLERAASWLEAYEAMLDGGIDPRMLLTSAVKALQAESNDLLISRLLEDLAEVFWRYLDASGRGFSAGPVERALHLRLNNSAIGASSNRWIAALARFACTAETAAELEAIWRGKDERYSALPESLSLRLAIRLALLKPQCAREFVDRQLGATRDPNRRSQLEFIAPALSADAATRDDLFARLVAGEGRGVWQVAALRLLSHPLRGETALDYLEPGIAHAAALRDRGDIFLPRQWLNALFFGHGATSAADRIRAAADGYDAPRFRSLILETADPVFRAAAIRERSAYP